MFDVRKTYKMDNKVTLSLKGISSWVHLRKVMAIYQYLDNRLSNLIVKVLENYCFKGVYGHELCKHFFYNMKHWISFFIRLDFTFPFSLFCSICIFIKKKCSQDWVCFRSTHKLLLREKGAKKENILFPNFYQQKPILTDALCLVLDRLYPV